MSEFNPFQAMLDAKSAEWRRERAETQMTLGKLIAALEAMPADTVIPSLCSPHSYRGYYSDLAFERGELECTAGKLLERCRNVMGRELTGYKGGEFLMGENTPVWVAHYGCCGQKLMTVRAGEIETAEDDA
jgi:hypothetical protein